jgi:uncharacterized protein YdeI (YjbR/CyaY-like superfamily)
MRASSAVSVIGTLALMATLTSKDHLPILGFASAKAFGSWLAKQHAKSPGIWLEIPKRGSGKRGPTYAEALDEALRFGWIDSQKAKGDDSCFLQRFTPRGPKSRWSKINREKIAVLIAAGRMEPAGLAVVEAAKQDGRWEAAYDSHRTATVPPDLQLALDANAKAKTFFAGLSSQNRFAILYRVQEAKRADTRARRIEKFVGMCARGETLS